MKMKEIVTCAEMKALDKMTIENIGIPSCVLMERAALKTAEEMERVFAGRGQKERILCVCGSGNNGGDGAAAARILFLHGYQAEIFLAGSRDRLTEETKRQLEIAANYHVPTVNNPRWDEYTTIVDAIFGVGLKRPVEGRYADLIRRMNAADAWKVAVDIPSGVDGDTGMELGTAFRADLTVTFGFAKAGLCLYPGRMLAGRTVTADIGIYRKRGSTAKCRYMEKEDLEELPERLPYGNKGTFGKVLAVAGSPGMCGAAYFCGAAAFAAGAGMVRIFTPEENRIPLQTLLPEAILSCAHNEEAMEEAFRWSDVLIVGPGIGTGPDSFRQAGWFLKKASEEKKPVILDADGLNLLARFPECREFLRGNVIVTPHMGEMSRLTGKSIEEIQKDRIRAAVSFAADTGAVCVLKDACTVAAGPDGEVWVNLSGNSGMASAGSGDVLAGVLAGIVCMYRSISETDTTLVKMAAAGVFLHGTAGDLAAEKKGQYGMKAGDMIPEISYALKRRKS